MKTDQAQHTPGPWAVGVTMLSDHESGAIQIVTSVAPTVGSVVFSRNREREEAEANARLIAAAPELLEACKEFLRFARLPDIVTRGDKIRYELCAISAVEKAIAKAEGRTE